MKRTPNLNPEIVSEIAQKLGLKFVPEKIDDEKTFCPEDLFDYIYAVLHSPTYREKYKEFLKIDFPRIPFTDNQQTFWKMVKLGHELRELHLLESPKVDEFITGFPVDGERIVEKPRFEKSPSDKGDLGGLKTDEEKSPKPPLSRGLHGKVWINAEQYFDNVPESAWNFYIGGYQPAQKWLKDRKGRTLSVDDLMHYQKMIVSLVETERIMGEIEGVFKI